MDNEKRQQMIAMRLEGATYSQIAKVFGISKQAVHDCITRHIDKISQGKRGHGFRISSIVYQGIYEHFEKNEDETVAAFAKAVFGDHFQRRYPDIKNFITGKAEARFTITQIKNMCKHVGKTFEEVFIEREAE